VQPLRWERRPDGLRAPALVCAFKGWNDAGEAASSAVSFMGAALEATRFATIDPEHFVDFQATRPLVKLVDGRTRAIEWPEWEVYEARIPRAPRDLVILTGPEPSYRWREFCGQVVELAEALGVQLVVTLGALLADVPHSRPVSVTAFASDPALVERLQLQPPTYEGPTGIVGVLQNACAEAGMPAASLWAAVPHYVAVAPNPKGALAVLRRLESLVGVTVDAQDLESARSAARSSSTPRCRRSSSASSAPPTRRRARPTSRSSRPATSSRASSSASSGSAGDPAPPQAAR
jgi:proteasome assembly chaperone (PAC2) family protein